MAEKPLELPANPGIDFLLEQIEPGRTLPALEIPVRSGSCPIELALAPCSASRCLNLQRHCLCAVILQFFARRRQRRVFRAGIALDSGKRAEQPFVGDSVARVAGRQSSSGWAASCAIHAPHWGSIGELLSTFEQRSSCAMYSCRLTACGEFEFADWPSAGCGQAGRIASRKTIRRQQLP